MQKWFGSAGICANEKGQILMVLQGQPHEEKVWSVPSGGLEKDETFEECCMREVWEETGYKVKVVKPLFVKEVITYAVPVEVHYFELELLGGAAKIQDPDELIYDIAWKYPYEIKQLSLSFPEDRQYLLDYLCERTTTTNTI